jgi:hypothetical protein
MSNTQCAAVSTHSASNVAPRVHVEAVIVAKTLTETARHTGAPNPADGAHPGCHRHTAAGRAGLWAALTRRAKLSTQQGETRC